MIESCTRIFVFIMGGSLEKCTTGGKTKLGLQDVGTTAGFYLLGTF
jgi:hypothetical protein